MCKESAQQTLCFYCYHLTLLSFTVADFRAHLIGGLLAFMGVAVFVLCVYNTFRIDIVLCYRSAFHSTGTTEGKCVETMKNAPSWYVLISFM